MSGFVHHLSGLHMCVCTSDIRHSTSDIRHSFQFPSNPLSSKKKSQQAMTNRHNKDQANRGVHANLLHFPVISLRGAMYAEISVPAKRGSWRRAIWRTWEHGNLANSASCGNGPLESNGIRIWRILLRVSPADREATTSSFQKSFCDASTFASYFGIFDGAPRIVGRMVA